jgi:alpha-tubulin suppressor-like RCC1 family protein
MLFDRVTAGWAITCAIENDSARTMYCIGYARGSITPADGTRSSPVAVPGGHAGSTADLGDMHVCGIDDAGTLFCWGSSDTGAHARPADSAGMPTAVSLPGPVHDVSAGRTHTCAIAGDGRDVYCWGGNAYGQLGMARIDAGERMPTAPVVFAP